MKPSPGTPDRPGAPRLPGVDLMRGFGALGVICVHAGIVVNNRISPAGTALQAWFDFVVAFFLVTALFFALRGEPQASIPWSTWLRLRFDRLLLPYLLWSALYLALHILKLAMGHQTGAIRALFHDPLGLLLNGGTGLALYFLPLLFISLVVAHALRPFLAAAPLWLLLLALAGTILAAAVMKATGNAYDLATARGFNHALPGLNAFPPARLLLALDADGVRSLPLILMAAILVRTLGSSPRPSPVSAAGALLAGMVALAIPPLAAHMGATGSVPEVVAGTGAFLIGWGLPVPASRLAAIVGAYSYGVYLVHQVVLEALQVAAQKAGLQPPLLGLSGVIALSLLVYALSMAIVAAADHGTPRLRRLFALR